MTTDHVATRTLVKSQPELWAECSDAASLARHIGEFGEITITRLDPETSIAWEAEQAVGTVVIEPSGWGTRVTLTAQTKVEAVVEDEQAADAPVPEAQSEASVPETQSEASVPQFETPVPETQSEASVPETQSDAPVPQAQPDPPVPEAQSAEEEADAKVEETLADPNPAVAADPASARGRWKRLIERTRTLFTPRMDEAAPLPEEDPVPAAAEDPVPATEEDPVPAAAEDPVPATEEDPVPAAEEDPVPATEEEPVPATDAIADEQVEMAEPPVTEPKEPVAVIEVAAEAQEDRVDPEAVLSAALDSLGQAHHRPFSRA